MAPLLPTAKPSSRPTPTMPAPRLPVIDPLLTMLPDKGLSLTPFWTSTPMLLPVSVPALSMVPPDDRAMAARSPKISPSALLVTLDTYPARSWPSKANIEIGRTHVSTPVTNAHPVCLLLLEKKHTLPKITHTHH